MYRILPMTRGVGLKAEREMEIVFSLVLHMKSKIRKDTSCEMAVAMAAPAVPRPNPKINRGSRKIFRIPPVDMPTIEYMAMP